jgi:hypothetical protein
MAITCLGNLARSVPAENIEKIIAGWKMSNADAEQLRWTSGNLHCVKAEFEWQADLVNGTPRQWILDLLEAQAKDYTEACAEETLALRARLRDWEIPVFPVTGTDLIQRGMEGGPVLGMALRKLKSDWVESQYTLTKKQMLETLYG